MRTSGFTAEHSEPRPVDGIEPVDLECQDCGALFRWTSGEQRFWIDRGMTHPPKRCKPCREARRAQSST